MNLLKFFKNPKPYVIEGKKWIKNNFRKYFYKGENVFCEICEWRGKRFFNKKCPKCNSLPRTRLVPYALKHFNLLSADLKILHIAPNRNEYQFVKVNFKNILIYDRLDIKQRRYTNIRQDITDTDLISNFYDLIIIWHVLEHVREDTKAITELFRVLKTNGKLLVSVPIYPKNNEITFEDTNIEPSSFFKFHGHHDHYRSCGLDYYKRFETLGFNTETLAVNDLDSNTIIRFGLKDDHIVWCFTK